MLATPLPAGCYSSPRGSVLTSARGLWGWVTRCCGACCVLYDGEQRPRPPPSRSQEQPHPSYDNQNCPRHCQTAPRGGKAGGRERVPIPTPAEPLPQGTGASEPNASCLLHPHSPLLGKGWGMTGAEQRGRRKTHQPRKAVHMRARLDLLTAQVLILYRSPSTFKSLYIG